MAGPKIAARFSTPGDVNETYNYPRRTSSTSFHSTTLSSLVENGFERQRMFYSYIFSYTRKINLIRFYIFFFRLVECCRFCAVTKILYSRRIPWLVLIWLIKIKDNNVIYPSHFLFFSNSELLYMPYFFNFHLPTFYSGFHLETSYMHNLEFSPVLKELTHIFFRNDPKESFSYFVQYTKQSKSCFSKYPLLTIGGAFSTPES